MYANVDIWNSPDGNVDVHILYIKGPTHIVYTRGEVGDNPVDRFLFLPSVKFMRNNEVRLSDSEKQRLKQYRDTRFDETVPYGFVVSQLLDEVADE
jgi:hypothetical protein